MVHFDLVQSGVTELLDGALCFCTGSSNRTARLCTVTWLRLYGGILYFHNKYRCKGNLIYTHKKSATFCAADCHLLRTVSVGSWGDIHIWCQVRYCLRRVIAVCSQIHTKHINTLCGQNVELLNVKLAVYKDPVRTAQ